MLNSHVAKMRLKFLLSIFSVVRYRELVNQIGRIHCAEWIQAVTTLCAILCQSLEVYHTLVRVTGHKRETGDAYELSQARL